MQMQHLLQNDVSTQSTLIWNAHSS